jgi:hypothetical protein
MEVPGNANPERIRIPAWQRSMGAKNPDPALLLANHGHIKPQLANVYLHAERTHHAPEDQECPVKHHSLHPTTLIIAGVAIACLFSLRFLRNRRSIREEARPGHLAGTTLEGLSEEEKLDLCILVSITPMEE